MNYSQIVKSMGDNKTYHINENLDVCTTSGENHKRFFRVKWETLNYLTPKDYLRALHKANAKGYEVWKTTHRSMDFPFTEEGYEKAVTYIGVVEHHNILVRKFYQEFCKLNIKAI